MRNEAEKRKKIAERVRAHRQRKKIMLSICDRLQFLNDLKGSSPEHKEILSTIMPNIISIINT